LDILQRLEINHRMRKPKCLLRQGRYPQSTPVLALLDHFTNTVNDIEDPQTRLEGVNRFVQVRGSLLALQKRAFLLDEVVADLRDARIE
jgi:hypothetical protein